MVLSHSRSGQHTMRCNSATFCTCLGSRPRLSLHVHLLNLLFITSRFQEVPSRSTGIQRQWWRILQNASHMQHTHGRKHWYVLVLVLIHYRSRNLCCPFQKKSQLLSSESRPAPRHSGRAVLVLASRQVANSRGPYKNTARLAAVKR